PTDVELAVHSNCAAGDLKQTWVDRRRGHLRGEWWRFRRFVVDTFGCPSARGLGRGDQLFENAHGVIVGLPSCILRTCQTAVEFVVQLAVETHPYWENMWSTVAITIPMGALNFALHHLALHRFCRQQHDKVVAPQDPLIDFGR